jgi:hypothetical protein
VKLKFRKGKGLVGPVVKSTKSSHILSTRMLGCQPAVNNRQRLLESPVANVSRVPNLRGDPRAPAAIYFADNVIRQDYLITRATKI